MLRIAICDDEPLWIKTAQDIVYNSFSDKQTEIQIDTFDSAERLLQMLFVRKEVPNILILDIDMPDTDGFKAAERIRGTYPNTLLLFYTSHEQYVFDAFRFQPFRYIRKTYVDPELKNALDAAVQVLKNSTEKMIELHSPDEVISVRTGEIMFFETNKRRCDVYLNNGRIVNIRKTIKELFAEVGERDFVMIHSGAVVNAKYLKSCSSYDVTLTDGKRLIVSRGRVKDVKTAMARYWGNRV